MKFNKFHSIENSYREKFLQRIYQHDSANKQWCVTEKVHGANFSFTTDGKVVKPAKRTSFLENVDKFYKCGDIVNKTIPKIKKLVNIVKANIENIDYITVYGELFGGFFKGEKKSQMIQKGVQYCPDHNFMAFDILVVDIFGNERYMNYYEAITLFNDVGLFHANILFEGTLSEVLEWSSLHNADDSTIPELLGHDKVVDNPREGHVLKPIDPAYLEDGTVIVLKDKNDKFRENSSVSKNKNKEKISNELQNCIEVACTYVHEERWNNLLSKEGPLQKRNDIGKYIILLAQDAIEDFRKDNDVFFSKPEMKSVFSAVKGASSKLVLSKF